MRFIREPQPGRSFNPHRVFTGVWIPDALLAHTKLSPGAKCCYAALCRFAGANGKCWPSKTKLATRLGVTDRQVKRYMAALVREKFIERQSRPGKTNYFIFLWHPIFTWRGGVRKDIHVTKPNQ